MRIAKSKKWYVSPSDEHTKEYIEALRIGLREQAVASKIPCGADGVEQELWSPPNENGYDFAANLWRDQAKENLNFQIFLSTGGEKPMPWKFPKSRSTVQEPAPLSRSGDLTHRI